MSKPLRPHAQPKHSEREVLLVEEYLNNNPDVVSAFNSYKHSARGYETQNIFEDFLRINPNIKREIERYIAANSTNPPIPP